MSNGICVHTYAVPLFLPVTYWPHSHLSGFISGDLIDSLTLCQKAASSLPSLGHSMYVFRLIKPCRVVDMRDAGTCSSIMTTMMSRPSSKHFMEAIWSSNSHHSLRTKLLLSTKIVLKLSLILLMMFSWIAGPGRKSRWCRHSFSCGSSGFSLSNPGNNVFFTQDTSSTW